MMEKNGLWVSSLTAETVANSSIRLDELLCNQHALYWIETRPLEKGRSALVKYSEALSEPLDGMSVRSRVHEYGGGSYTLFGSSLYFCYDLEKAIYKKEAQGNIECILKKSDCSHADFAISPNESFLYCVEEDRSTPDVKNRIVCIDLISKVDQIVAEGHDFYAYPKISPDGKWLAYITWDFPNMPWDGSDLWVAEILSDGKLGSAIHVAGGKEESVLQPLWSKHGSLYFTSDCNGYWNLFVWDRHKTACLFEAEADFAAPLWKLGRYQFAHIAQNGSDVLVCSYTQNGIDRLGLLYVGEKRFERLDLPFTVMTHVCAQDEKHVYCIAGSPTMPRSIVRIDLKMHKYDIIRQSASVELSEKDISIPDLLFFPSCIPGKESSALYYPPTNSRYEKQKTPCPVIVLCHGGPTAHSLCLFNLEVQYWTTRGFGVLDVNYGGSSGFGRDYRKRLENNWGIVDVQDVILAANALIHKKIADPSKIVIRGGSSGGFTVLSCLATSSLFAAGTSYYGVSDLEKLVQDTHKFELRYLDKLIAPYPEKKEIYRQRAPIYQIDKICAPVLFLQGKEDLVVPLSQSVSMYEKLKSKGNKTELVVFEEEGHGFRQQATIKKALEVEYQFYLDVCMLR